MDRTKKRVIAILIALAIILAAIFGIMSVLGDYAKRDNEFVGLKKYTIDGDEYYKKNNVVFMLYGIDYDEEIEKSATHNNNYDADFISLICINRDDKTYSTVVINRDTVTEFDLLDPINGKPYGTDTKQITLANTYGDGKDESAKNLKKAVSGLFKDDNGNGLLIDYYACLSMGAVSIINDEIGGVTVTLPLKMKEGWNEGEQKTLLGEDALYFVRARLGLPDMRNEKRVERQSEYLNAFTNKLMDKELNIVQHLNIEELHEKLQGYYFSNYSYKNLKRLMEYVSDYRYLGVMKIEGEANLDSSNQYVEFTPNKDSINNILKEIFYEKT